MGLSPGRYADREEAGRAVAEQLRRHATCGADLLVLGLARGGVPVAATVASALGASLDVLVARKLGTPGRPELALGAIAAVGVEVELVSEPLVLAQRRIPAEAFDAICRRELVELRRRQAAYRGGRPAAQIASRAVIVVDDGLATGSTMRAAVAAVRRQQPRWLAIAVPVGPEQTCRELRGQVEELVCVRTPSPFRAVGQAYRDFSPTSDTQVRRILADFTP